MSREVKWSSNPHREEDRLVEKVKHKSDTWYFVPSQVKSLHAIGRTCPRVGTMVTQEQVDDLVKEYGTSWEGTFYSITQQLDFIATEILRVDRLENVPAKHSERKDYLSPNQWYMRMRREIPFPDIDAVLEARNDPTRRTKNYHIRFTDIPWDKKGDHYTVWSRT
jgi:hypothetical protein